MPVREGRLLAEALDQLRKTLPCPLPGLDTDNGSEFLNDTLISYCSDQGIELTRSRLYRTNDQARVEQQNGAAIRRMVGYGRLEGVATAETLARLYSASRLFVNVFQLSFKLAEKTREGAEYASAITDRRPRVRGWSHRMRFPKRQRTVSVRCGARWNRSGSWTRSAWYNTTSPPWLRARRSSRCRNAMPNPMWR